MHKLLIVSDSHGLTNELTMILQRHSDVDAAIHCGDSELEVNAPYLQGYTVVKGNCDWQGTFPEVTHIEMGELKILVTHGHLYDIKSTMLPIQYLGMEQEADVICFGHSHVAYAEVVEGRLYLNPGSIRLPKRYPVATYAIVEWNKPEAVTVRFYEIDGTEITDFPYESILNLG